MSYLFVFVAVFILLIQIKAVKNVAVRGPLTTVFDCVTGFVIIDFILVIICQLIFV